MNVRVLQSEADIFEAKKVLHECYVQTQNWTPPQGNPSGFKTENLNNHKILTDNFDHRSQWIGAFENGKMIACCRILMPHKEGLEVSLYNANSVSDFDLSSVVELNRFAILKGYESTFALPMLVKTAINLCVEFKFTQLVTTMSYPQPAEFAEKVGFKCLPNSEFKYSKEDQRPVFVFSFDLQNRLNLERLNNIFNSLMVA